MAVEYLDEVAQPPAGVEWVDAPAASGVEFLNGDASPVSAAELKQRFKDPSYNPSRAEYDIWQKAQDERGMGQRAGDFLSKAGDAFSGVWDSVVKGVKGVGKMITDPETNDPLVTGVEGVARGVRNDTAMVKGLVDKVVKPDTFLRDEAQKFLNQKVYEFQGGDVLDPSTAKKPTMEQRKAWQAEFEKDVLPDLKYRQFIYDRWRKGVPPPDASVSVITGQPAPFNADVADAQSLVTSPMVLVPFGKAMTPAKSLARGAAAQVLEKGGRAAEIAGEAVRKVAAVPEKLAGRGFTWLSGSADAGAAAENVVKRGSVPTAAAGLAGFGVPGLTETAAAVAGGKVAGRTLQGAGEAAQAAGRSVAEGPSRYGLFDRIAKDSKAPEWLRRAANAAKPLDPAVSLAGSAAKGGAEGAAIGTVLGAAADGEEGAAAGFGSGLAFGAGGGLAGRIVGAGRYNEGLKERDLAAWLGSKSADEVANISNLKLSRDQALNLADMERLAKGVGQDVEFRYVTDKQFSELFGVGKGAQVVNGDRPVVFVNTGYKGGRSMFHETLHALDALEGFAPQRQQLNRVLFDQTLPDGQVVSKGIYTAADLAEFTSQYRSRLNEAARSEFDLLTPEDRTARIMSEVRSESFANLVNGYSGNSVLGSRGIKRRVADALLLAEGDAMLGKMRRALESVGVKFEASGDPSELFVKNGKPITNTPAVDAALRDYVRAKDNITRKLVAGDGAEEPTLVVRPGDLLSKGNAGLVDTFKDFDVFAKNPDGSVKMMGGVPVLLSEREIKLVQSKRVDAMIDALTKVPNLGEADSVKLKPNGAWEGRVFSEKQIAAFDALPDDVLSPAMKAKLRQLNELARQDGQQIILDYNAALRGGRYSSGIAPSTRAAVPLTFNISKAGNFYMTTLDTTHFFRKLGQWRKSKPRAFDAWGGDVDAFLRDSFTYLDNHVNGRSGAVNLDSDAAAAVHKKNVINDFFNVPKGAGNEDANPVQLSQRGDKDNLIRSRRFDRINRITPGAGDKFPIRYELQKANFMPAAAVPTSATSPQAGSARLTLAAVGVSPVAIHKQVRAQAEFDLAAKSPGPANLNQRLASAYLDVLDKKLNKGSALTRTVQLQRIKAMADNTSAPEMATAFAALLTGGQNGAKTHLELLAAMKAVLSSARTH